MGKIKVTSRCSMSERINDSKEPSAVELTSGPAVQTPTPASSIIDAITSLKTTGAPETQEQTQAMANEQFDADLIVMGNSCEEPTMPKVRTCEISGKFWSQTN
jgi:hypothetical protein